MDGYWLIILWNVIYKLDYVNLHFKTLTHFICFCPLVPGAGTPYGVFPSQAQLYAAAAAAQGPPPTYDQSLAHPAAATAAAVNQQVGFKNRICVSNYNTVTY